MVMKFKNDLHNLKKNGWKWNEGRINYLIKRTILSAWIMVVTTKVMVMMILSW